MGVSGRWWHQPEAQHLGNRAEGSGGQGHSCFYIGYRLHKTACQKPKGQASETREKAATQVLLVRIPNFAHISSENVPNVCYS